MMVIDNQNWTHFEIGKSLATKLQTEFDLLKINRQLYKNVPTKSTEWEHRFKPEISKNSAMISAWYKMRNLAEMPD